MDIIVGENLGDDFTTVNAAFAEVISMGALSEPAHIKMRKSDALFIPNQRININGVTTTAENKIVLSLYDDYSDKNTIDSNTLLKTAAGLSDLFQIRNGCDHIEFRDFNVLLDSNCKIFGDYRTTVDASSKILISRIYNNLVAGATANSILIASRSAPSKSILVENCNFKASSLGIQGNPNVRDALQVVNTPINSTRGSNSGTFGMRYLEANKTYSAGFGGANGYFNYLDLALTSQNYAADDSSGVSDALDNIALSAAYADAENENWFYAENSPLQGGATDGSDIAFMRSIPVATSPVLTGSISVESKTDTSFTVRARSDSAATAQVIVSSPASTQPTDAAFDASDLKAASSGTEDVLIAVTGKEAFTDYKIHLRFKPEIGTSSYYTFDVKTTPVAPAITSINGGNPLIPNVEFEIVGTGFTGHEAADIGGTAQVSFNVDSDTRATAIAVRPSDLDNNVSGTLNVGGGTGSITFISGVGWGSAVISVLASENLLPSSPALQAGDKVYYSSNSIDLTVYADGSYLLRSTNATEQVEVDVFREGAWLDRQTVTLTSAGQSANTAPQITSATSVNVTAGQTLTYTATASDADTGDTVTISYSDLPNGATVSSSVVTWATAESTQSSTATFNVIATDQNGATATQQVTVNIAATPDTEKPVITKTGGDTSINVGDTYTPPSVTVTDNVDQNIAVVKSGDTVNPDVAGTYTERYNYTDQAGNAADEVTHTVVVSAIAIQPPADTEKPVILLSGGKTEHILGQAIEYPVATVTDDRELKSSEILTKTNYVEGEEGDFYVVYYGPEDVAGNTADPVVFEFNVRLPQQIAAFDLELIGSDRKPFASESVNLRVLNAKQEELVPLTQVTTTEDGKITVESDTFKSGDALYAELHFSDSTYAGYPAVARPL